jgi:hypothetical protein
MPFEFSSHRTSGFSNSRDLGSQFRIVNQLLNVSHLIRPFNKALPGDRITRRGCATALLCGCGRLRT